MSSTNWSHYHIDDILHVHPSGYVCTSAWAAAPPDDAFEKSVYEAFNSARTLLLQKHQDYGPKNISNAPGGPLNGLRVRMYDKLARINNLVESGAEPENESLRDSFMDLANYGIIGLLVLDGHWPGAPK